MVFTEKLLKELIEKVNGSLKINYQGTKIDFSGEWPKYSMRDLIHKHCGIDIYTHKDKDSLAAEIKAKKIILEDVDFNKIGWGNLIDQLYKKVARPDMIQPQFLMHHPIELSPLARKNDKNPKITDRFQLVVNGWEMLNAYSELVDPIDQRERLENQAKARLEGDDEAMIMEEDFIQCMEYGMPPISGWGMGIDRFVALLSDQENLRETVLFPLMRPADKIKTNVTNILNETNDVLKEAASDKDGELELCSPEDIVDIGISMDKAEELFKEKLTSEGMITHSIASAAVMKGIAKHFKLNEEAFYILGLLHDLDFDLFPGMNEHGRHTAKWLKEAGMIDKALHAILAHNAEGTGTQRETFLDFAITAAETITGLISATAKVYPDKKVASVKVKSIIKRMKKKDFAAKVSRENIMLCEKIGLDLNQFSQIALESMQEVADKIGL